MSVVNLTATPKRRNRAKKPAWSYSGLTLEQWQADSSRVHWAQTDAMFKDVLTVLINTRTANHTINQPGGHSEGYHLGCVRGFEAAIATLQALASGATPPRGELGEPDYPATD